MLPEGFISMLASLGLGDAADAIASARPEVSVRLNRSKPAVSVPVADEDGDGSVAPGTLTPVPWCEGGVYLPSRPVFALDPQWHQGRYYVQEGGSMFISHVIGTLRPRWDRPIAVLDACAAPGGKTTAVIDAVPSGSLVVANEYVPARAAVLRENIIKWGSPSTVVTRADTRVFASMPSAFDLVIADVPCSGEGMMRKDDDAVAQWSRALIRECADRQWEIVRNLWTALAPGGIMVYSTCTFNREEDELMVHRILDELGGESVDIPVGPDWHITPALLDNGSPDPTIHAYRFIPGRTRGEGLFLSVIRKAGDSDLPMPPEPAVMHRGKEKRRVKEHQREQSRGKKERASAPPSTDIVASWLRNPADYTIYTEGDRVTAFPRRWMPMLERLRRSGADIIHEGVHVATLRGRDLLPAHGLVMSSAFDTDAIPGVELDTATALAYLRGQSPVLPADTPRGPVVLYCLGAPLGLVKNLGSRTNTLYPQQWRLRMG